MEGIINDIVCLDHVWLLSDERKKMSFWILNFRLSCGKCLLSLFLLSSIKLNVSLLISRYYLNTFPADVDFVDLIAHFKVYVFVDFRIGE